MTASWGLLTSVLLIGQTPPPPDYPPDPASVRRFGPAYRYPQSGWIVLHIEGEPYDRGYQHGYLLADEIAAYADGIAKLRSPKAPAEAWRDLRMLTDALFLRKYDAEYLEEMKGIADGASAAGAKFLGRSLDLHDIVAINSDIEVEFLDSGLEALATGLEGRRFKEPADGQAVKPRQPHCSAFAAVGPATADGKIVFGHITMFGIHYVRHFNVWLDVKPTKGHRTFMQTYPAGIMSGLDYYYNDAGLVVCETTIRQTKFDVQGSPLASRIRKALQYAATVDGAVDILKNGNNGLYTNEWLLADVNANEVAMFELGTHKNRLWRSSKREWIEGQAGFYWGCNNARDMDVKIETLPSLVDRPANLVPRPSDRDVKWLELFRETNGKIDEKFGFKAFTTPPLSAFSSCDAKFTTTKLAKDLKTWALFGPPRGKVWDPTDEQLIAAPHLRPLVPNEWTLLGPDAPAKKTPTGGQLAVDTKPGAKADSEDEPDMNRPPVWRGTILPTDDADMWLAGAFADFQRIVALEKAWHAKNDDRSLSAEGKRRVDRMLFAHTAYAYAAAVRHGADVPLAQTKRDYATNEWCDIAVNKGVLLLHRLRQQMGADRFDKAMDDFGLAHAGKPVGVATFRSHMEKAIEKPIDWRSLEPVIPVETNGSAGQPERHLWSIDSFDAEPHKALIVVGTALDKSANAEAGRRLQRWIERRWCNVTVPIVTDSALTDAQASNHHLLFVGRPASNAALAKCVQTLPVKFGATSFNVAGTTYGHESTAVLAAGRNPHNARYSIVAFAGMDGESTWHCVEKLSGRGGLPAPAVVLFKGVAHRPVVFETSKLDLPTSPAAN